MAGDILDKFIFPRINKGKETGWNWITDKKNIDSTRIIAQESVGVQTGIYKISKLISDNMGGLQSNLIQIKNESAKFFRSLIFPLLIYGFWNIYANNIYFGILSILMGFILIKVYGSLKGSHMSNLYSRVAKLTKEDTYQSISLNDEIQLHLWDGNLITTSKIEKIKTVDNQIDG